VATSLKNETVSSIVHVPVSSSLKNEIDEPFPPSLIESSTFLSQV
jgi:hypothetical protein